MEKASHWSAVNKLEEAHSILSNSSRVTRHFGCKALLVSVSLSKHATLEIIMRVKWVVPMKTASLLKINLIRCKGTDESTRGIGNFIGILLISFRSIGVLPRLETFSLLSTFKDVLVRIPRRFLFLSNVESPFHRLLSGDGVGMLRKQMKLCLSSRLRLYQSMLGCRSWNIFYFEPRADSSLPPLFLALTA